MLQRGQDGSVMLCLCDVYCCQQAMLQRGQDGSVMLCLCDVYCCHQAMLQRVSKLVFHAQSTGAVISGQASERSRGFSDDVFMW